VLLSPFRVPESFYIISFYNEMIFFADGGLAFRSRVMAAVKSPLTWPFLMDVANPAGQVSSDAANPQVDNGRYLGDRHVVVPAGPGIGHLG
jgi:hypothetical protein